MTLSRRDSLRHVNGMPDFCRDARRLACFVAASAAAFRPSQVLEKIPVSMTPPNTSPTYQLQVPEEICHLIDRAAATTSKSRADFMLNALLDVAQSALLEQSLFRVSDGQMKAFEKALDEPLDENLAFQKFLARKAPWKR
ncbi:DUF1778 domain-containing protein [Roseateles chitinivorans]|uniref:type II toxin-antitoxin system TacA family antitoxin n=1 Tax=Roseateles chitinivorans TaxID=2917965 RepID=UPI003D6744F7